MSPSAYGAGTFPVTFVGGVTGGWQVTSVVVDPEAIDARQGFAAHGDHHLIPIRKSAAWWALPQDERRAIFEARSHHIAQLAYLPRIARRLYHARDLGEPFDFLTWFEYAPEHVPAFEELVGLLRSREEWTFVEREVDVRLER